MSTTELAKQGLDEYVKHFDNSRSSFLQNGVQRYPSNKSTEKSSGDYGQDVAWCKIYTNFFKGSNGIGPEKTPNECCFQCVGRRSLVWRVPHHGLMDTEWTVNQLHYLSLVPVNLQLTASITAPEATSANENNFFERIVLKTTNRHDRNVSMTS